MKRVVVLLVTLALIAGAVGCPADPGLLPDPDPDPSPPLEYGLTLSSSLGGQVTTPGEGTFAYEAGSTISLVAQAEEGYRFVNWTGDVATVADAGAARTTITMNRDYNITANFGKDPINSKPREIPAPTMFRSGTLTDSETWSGVVLVTGDVIVPEGTTLTIEPGTVVLFAHNREDESKLTLQNYFEWPKLALHVFGILRASGCPSNLIVFTSDALEPRGADWRGIIINGRSSDSLDRSIVSYAIVEYAHKSIMFCGSATGSHLVENCILRLANRVFRKAPGGIEFEGGSGVTYWDASSPIVRGNIIYGNTHNLEIRGLGRPAIENNVIAFGQKEGDYFGGANGIRTWGAEGTPVFRNNLLYGNWWGIEFNWGSEAVFKNNVVVENDVGVVIWQGDPGETKAHPVMAFNNVWGNGIDYSSGSIARGHGHLSPGKNDMSVNPEWTEENFWNADFLPKNPVLQDAGDPEFTDPDGSRSDIGPNWDWSWIDGNLLVTGN